MQQKFIGVSPARVTPAQGGVGAIDNLCVAAFGAGYKGLVTDGVNRIATVNPNAGDGQVGWVVAPYTRYVSIHSNLLVFVSDNTRLIGASGGQDRSLENPIGTAAQDDNYGVWVGAEADWRSSFDCLNWTSNSASEYGVGPATQATGTGNFPNNGGVSLCSNTRRFFCIQQ